MVAQFFSWAQPTMKTRSMPGRRPTRPPSLPTEAGASLEHSPQPFIKAAAVPHIVDDDPLLAGVYTIDSAVRLARRREMNTPKPAEGFGEQVAGVWIPGERRYHLAEEYQAYFMREFS